MFRVLLILKVLFLQILLLELCLSTTFLPNKANKAALRMKRKEHTIIIIKIG